MSGDPGEARDLVGLRESLRDLIPDYRGPVDPVPRVGASIRRRRGRRRAWLTVGSAATAAAVAALAPVVLAALQPAAPVSAARPPAAPPAPTGRPATPVPEPVVHPVASGVVAGARWRVGSTSLSDAAGRCLLATGGPFVRHNACFDGWTAGAAATWSAQLVRRPDGGTVTAVLGVAPPPAAEVAVALSDGRTVRVAARRTRTDPDARFFALVVDRRVGVRSVTAFAAGGRPVGEPVTDPGPYVCTPAPDLGCAVPASSPS